MSSFSKFLRKTVIRSLFKDLQAENQSLLRSINGKIDKLIRHQLAVDREDQPPASAPDERPLDMLITHNEICSNHGTGVLLKRLFEGSPNLMNLRSCTQFGGKSLGDIQILLNHERCSRVKSFLAVSSALVKHSIRRILCVPFYPDDAINAIAAHEVTGAPLCLYLLDDQNIHCQGIPDALMRELIEKAHLRFAVGPDMRDAYEKKFEQKIWVLPPVVSAEFIRSNPPAANARPAAAKGVMVGNIWSSSWLEALRCLIRESGITVDWYGNTAKHLLSYDEEELAKDGIRVQGFVTEQKLQELLRGYAFAIVPSACSDPNETHQWQGELSLPSRMPYLMATANIPILVLSNQENPATDFVRRFEIGAVCDYVPANFQRAVETICLPEAQQKYRANAAAKAPLFSSEGIAEWIWQSLKQGEPVDRRFEETFQADARGGSRMD